MTCMGSDGNIVMLSYTYTTLLDFKFKCFCYPTASDYVPQYSSILSSDWLYHGKELLMYM